MVQITRMDSLVQILLGTFHEMIQTYGQLVYNFEHELPVHQPTSSLQLESLSGVVPSSCTHGMRYLMIWTSTHRRSASRPEYL